MDPLLTAMIKQCHSLSAMFYIKISNEKIFLVREICKILSFGVYISQIAYISCCGYKKVFPLHTQREKSAFNNNLAKSIFTFLS
jgi:hypothetical protein